MSQDYTPQLQQLMRQAGFSSFKALSQAAGISEKQLRQLRRGNLARLRLETLAQLAQALQISIAECLTLFAGQPSPPASAPTDDLQALRQEYDRLQTQLNQQRQVLWQEFQQTSLQVLEPLLLQLPTAAYAAQNNPTAPAVQLLPLLTPLDRLLESWGIRAIAPVGAELPYDPHWHQLMEGTVEPGRLIRVRYTGYRQGDRLLYRARVSPVVPG
jgi:molecular chaperone GrpE (heat shock protein)